MGNHRDAQAPAFFVGCRCPSTDARFPKNQGKSIRTSNAIERLRDEFVGRIETPTLSLSAETAAMSFRKIAFSRSRFQPLAARRSPLLSTAVTKPAVKKASSAAQYHVGDPASTSAGRISSLKGSPAAKASSNGQNHVRDLASTHFAPQISSLHESPAAVGKPAVAEASSDAQKNHVGGPSSAASTLRLHPPRPWESRRWQKRLRMRKKTMWVVRPALPPRLRLHPPRP